jgi:hypothetical protein
MSYPIIRKDRNNKYKISLLKDKLSTLCFFAINSDCTQSDLTDYEIKFTIYDKENKNRTLRQAIKNGTGKTMIGTDVQTFDTDDNPTK